MDYSSSESSTQSIHKLITDFMAISPLNTLESPFEEPAFEDFLLGFVAGDDQIFVDYKKHVGDFHWTPKEAFDLAFPGNDAAPEDLTIISWVLPHREIVKSDNRKQIEYPAERWIRARIPGERFNKGLRLFLASQLTEMGFAATAPHHLPDWAIMESEEFTFASKWSERHMAYAAGLGTFGLSDGLITPRGKAHRVGSVVVRLKIESTPRPYTDHRAYCLFFHDQSCLVCAERCPVGALSAKGHAKVICRHHVHDTCMEYSKTVYNFDGYGCGLCQVKVPCESRIPTKRQTDQ